MTTPAARAMDGSRHGEYFPTLFRREPRGNQAATAQARFHHHSGPGKATDDPIALGKMRTPGFAPRRIFGNQQSVLRDFLGAIELG